MRTTITIDDQIFLEAKQLAAESHKSFANVVEDALRQSFALKSSKNKKMISLLSAGEGGLVHGVDLDNSASLDFKGGVLLYSGANCFSIDELLYAVPMDRLWK